MNFKGKLDGSVSQFQGLTLAGPKVEQQLLGILQQLEPGRSKTACELARKLQIEKKEVNYHLYKLLSQGKLCRTGEGTPLWRLADSPNPQGTVREDPCTSKRSLCSPPAAKSLEQSSATNSKAYINLPIIAEVKEKICKTLFDVKVSTALNLAKNIGFSKARDVNATLYFLEKTGDVCKENSTPPRWSLTDNKRKSMQLKIKAEEVWEIASLVPDPAPESLAPVIRQELSETVPTPPLPSPPSPLQEGKTEKVENGQQLSEPAELPGDGSEPAELPGDGSTARTGPPHSNRARYQCFLNYENFENSKWATDDILEDLNAISNHDESRGIMESLSASYTAQFDTVFLSTPLEKLMACQKNPLSGLIEYTHYTNQQFVMLKQSGPSHEPSGMDSDLNSKGKNDKLATQIGQVSSSNMASPRDLAVKPKRKDTLLAPTFSKLHQRESKYTINKRFLEDFVDIEEIGCGGFGLVFKAKHDIDNRVCAVKRVKLSFKEKEAAQCEVKVLAKLDHENIVRYYSCWIGKDRVDLEDSMSDNSSLCDCLFIDMEFCEKGTLADWMKLQRGAKNCKNGSLMKFQQIVEGVTYIHSQNLIHRDLKPLNILISKEDKIKISDFGLVTTSVDDPSVQRTENRGTQSYMAPEQAGRCYGKEVDIFPLGLILFEMLYIFETVNEKSREWPNIRKCIFPQTFDKEFPIETPLIKKMLSEEPRKRPLATMLLKYFSQSKQNGPHSY